MRYIVGIDLGTTNSAVAYVDTTKPPYAIQLFSIPQFVGIGRVESQSTLPSFCYLVAKEEWPPGSLTLPWKQETHTFVGELAKTQGARVPTRLVQSAKSWLCNVAANRRDKILPVEAADISQRLSPVEASAKYLNHLKDAWNAAHPHDELEEQDVILTVPASFDEVARLLTVEAARLAGLNQITLLEEPQAAFYSWISQHEKNQLKEGETILVCDVGGGTTDFSLIEVHQKEDQLVFQRMAVGDHLLLGGDNMDAALAHYVDQKLNTPLSATQWHQIQAEARNAKEYLLQDSLSPEATYSVVLQGTGASVIKGSASVTLKKSEVEDLLLKGFFGEYDLQEALQIRRSRGVRTMGLPYEDEPSITKHMAHFLQQARYLERGVDYLLFNGGTMKPTSFQNAIASSLARWFKEPKILSSASLDLAVARGSAYYGKAKRGLGITIGGGIPRTYYLEVEIKESGKIIHQALTLLPRGSEEGASFEPQQTFFVKPNTPVSFSLLTSHVRLNDEQGQFLPIDEQEMQRLPPIQTILRYGRRQGSSQENIPVHLGIRLTAVGTLELWLQSQATEHRWDFEFQVRTHQVRQQEETFDVRDLTEAKQSIEKLFSGQLKPNQVMEKLEEQLELERREWPSSILRALWDPLLQFASKRKASEALNNRWWNLAGFFLRPGFGYPLDDFRMKEVWKIILVDLKETKNLETQIQQWICFRRVAGGLNKGQQMQLASEILSVLFNKKSARIEVKSKTDEYAYSEKIRAIASLERIEIPMKVRLGEAIIQRIVQGEAVSADYWALARIGARHLVYGSIGQVVPRETCEKWIVQLLNTKDIDIEQLTFVLNQLARKTDHRELNVSESILKMIVEKVGLFDSHTMTTEEQEQILGDRLPAGLVLIRD